MVNSVKNVFSKYAFCAAAGVYAALFCCGVITVSVPRTLRSLIPREAVTELRARIASDPVKTADGRSYRCIVDVSETGGAVKGCRNAVFSSANGRALVYIPTAVIEAQYPGKLYSQLHALRGTDSLPNRTMGLAESGAEFLFSVTPANGRRSDGLPAYTVHQARYIGFETSLRGKIRKLRAVLRLSLKRLLYGWGDAGGLLLALLTGSAEYTGEGVRASFQKAGAAHILALSGMHLSLFSGMADTVIRLIGGKKAASYGAYAAAVLFVWFAGSSPSLLRALISATLCAVCRSCGLKPRLPDVLAASFFIQLCAAPESIYNVSFALSYAALAGMATIGRLVQPLVCRCPFIPKKTAVNLSTSFGAQLGAAPVTVVVFKCFAPGGGVASMLVTPLVSVFLTVGLAAAAVSFVCPQLRAPLGGIINLLYTCIIRAVCLCAKIPPLEF